MGMSFSGVGSGLRMRVGGGGGARRVRDILSCISLSSFI